ncbi:MAG: rRNA pseudouridylate synthase [Gammaproteobacteria bacterium]|jgi:23S rRNA pseudouridine955/2504/2580 synthase|nr:rRNA pseudouridylate synthase [Gammaproteobacteria bacterium]
MVNENIKLYTIDEHQIDQRIDNFLFSHLKGIPKSRLYRALRSGEIRVNKKRVKAPYRLCEGDIVRIPPLRVATREEKMAPSQKFSQSLETSVIYEDKHIIIINKPSGVASHGGSGINFGVIETFRYLRPKLAYLELVHRLDRETTGCLILAKKPSVLKALHKMLLERKVNKTYLALVENAWEGGKKHITAPLLKNQLSSGERIATVHKDGKPSETIFTPLHTFQNVTLVSAKPLTGRTHQIRVHAAHIGHPVLGDQKYGSGKYDKPYNVKHLLLHAASLEFTLPATEEKISLCACLDEAFGRLLKDLT